VFSKIIGLSIDDIKVLKMTSTTCYNIHKTLGDLDGVIWVQLDEIEMVQAADDLSVTIERMAV
jgi:hypothetical protein